MTDANIKLAQKTITCKSCGQKKTLDSMKYITECIDCSVQDIGKTLDEQVDEIVMKYKKETRISKEEEKGIRKWLIHALTFIKEEV